jgi:hypothetical protein
MKRIGLLTGVFFLLTLTLYAQQSVSASGGNATGSGGTVSYTVAQVDYISVSSSNGNINQGVQQPYEFFISDIARDDDICLQSSVFPNPTYASVILKIESCRPLQDLSYSLYDIQGKLLFRQKIGTHETTIPFETYASGAYFLKVFDANEELKIFKVVKNQ